MGSPLKPAMRFFSRVASQGWDDTMRPELAIACLYAKAIFESEEPRLVNIDEQQTPILVFTDGAWEPDAEQPAGAGVVVVDPVSGTRCSHEIDIPEAVVNHWKGLGKSQLIAELELLPVVICFEAYQQLFHRRRVLVFVDNNAVRDTIAKASTRSLTLMVLLSELHRLWGSIQCLAWVSRVPSKSNIADLPSRQLPAEAAKIIGGIHGPDLKPSSSLCRVICDSTSFVSHMRNVLMKIEKHNSLEKKG